MKAPRMGAATYVTRPPSELRIWDPLLVIVTTVIMKYKRSEMMNETMPPGPRIRPVAEPDPEVAEVLSKTLTDARGAPLNIFATLATHPRLLKPLNVLGGLFLAHGLLPERY